MGDLFDWVFVKALFGLVEGFSVLWWNLDKLLLFTAYMLHKVRLIIGEALVVPLLNAMPAMVGGHIRAAFLLAVMLLGVTYLVRSFFKSLTIVDTEKLFLWGAVAIAFLGVGTGAQLYRDLEGFRDGLAFSMYDTVMGQQETLFPQLAEAFGNPKVYGPADPGGVAPVVRYPADNPTASIRGYSVAGAFVRATMDDVLHPLCVDVACREDPGRICTYCYPLPKHYSGIPDAYCDPDDDYPNSCAGVAFTDVYWPAGPWPNLPHPADYDSVRRHELLTLADSGGSRLFLGLVPCILALVEAIIFLCLTIATAVLFLTFPIALIFSFFKYTETIATGMIKMYIQVFVKTLVISVMFSIVFLLVLAAAAMNNATVFLGGSVVGILFGINFVDDGIRSMAEAAKSFSTGLAQATGMKGDVLGAGKALGGALGKVGGAGLAGALAAGSGMGVMGAAGAAATALGGQRAYTALAAAEALGLSPKKGAVGRMATSFQRGSRVFGLSGGRFTAMSAMQLYQMRGQNDTTRAIRRYERAEGRLKKDMDEHPEKKAAFDRQFERFQADQAAGKAGTPPPEMQRLMRLRQGIDRAQSKTREPFMGGVFGRAGAAQYIRPAKFDPQGGGPDREPWQQYLRGSDWEAGEDEGQVGVSLGHIREMSSATALDHLQGGMTLTAGRDGNVEAIPTEEFGIPPEAYSAPLDNMDDPREMLGRGLSVAVDPDGRRVRYWQSEMDVDQDFRSRPEAALRRGARASRDAAHHTGRVGSSAAQRGARPATARPAGAPPADVPGMPLDGAAAPKPGTAERGQVSVDPDLAAVLAPALLRAAGETGPTQRPTSIPDNASAQVIAQVAAGEGTTAEKLGARRLRLRGTVSKVLDQLRQPPAKGGLGLGQESVLAMMYNADGTVNPQFAQYISDRAAQPAPPSGAQVVVGRTPQDEVARVTAARMQALSGAGQPLPADLEPVLRASIREFGGGGGTVLQAGETLGSRNVAQAMVAAQSAASQPGMTLESLRAILGTGVGASADQMLQAMAANPAQAVSIVGTVSQEVQTLRGRGMNDEQIAELVLTGEGQVRPEFMQYVVGHAAEGASAYVGTASGRQSMEFLVAAGLGAEATRDQTALVGAVAQSVAGSSEEGAIAVARQLGIRHRALANATPAINAMVQVARQHTITGSDLAALVAEVQAGAQDTPLQERLRQGLIGQGLPAEGADEVLTQLRGTARSLPTTVRDATVLRPRPPRPRS